MISVNGASTDLAAVAAASNVSQVYARNGESGEWVLVWPSNTIDWLTNTTATSAATLQKMNNAGVYVDCGITATLSNIVLHVGYDKTEKWTDVVGNTGDHVGRMVYGSDFDASVPALSFDIAFSEPLASMARYKLKATLGKDWMCNGSRYVVIPRNDYTVHSNGGSTILYGTSSKVTINSSGVPTLEIAGSTYYGWSSSISDSFPRADGYYSRTVANNASMTNGSIRMRYGQDYWPSSL